MLAQKRRNDIAIYRLSALCIEPHMLPSGKVFGDLGSPSTISALGDTLVCASIVTGENSAAYLALEDQMKTAIQPRDALERIWFADAVNLEWELIRMRRLKANVMETAASRGLESVLRGRHEVYLAERLVERWHAREASAVERVRALLGAWGLKEEDIAAHGAYLMLNEIERIDNLIGRAEERRNRALNEISARRQTSATTSLIQNAQAGARLRSVDGA